MTKDEFRKAFKRRDNDPLIKSVRPVMTAILELWRSTPQGNDVASANALGLLMVDNAAIFLAQTGTSKEDFLAWATESYDLYSRLAEVAKPPQGVPLSELKARAKEVTEALLAEDPST